MILAHLPHSKGQYNLSLYWGGPWYAPKKCCSCNPLKPRSQISLANASKTEMGGGGERGGIIGTILGLCRDNGKENGNYYSIIGFIWVVVKIMVPFWIPIIIWHLIFREPKKGP